MINKKPRIVKGYDITKQILHDSTHEQYIQLIEYQKFQCFISGNPFTYDEDKKNS